MQFFDNTQLYSHVAAVLIFNKLLWKYKFIFTFTENMKQVDILISKNQAL